jgi:Zn-dependent protease with chaperone function
MRLGDPLQTLWFDGRSPRPRAVRLRLLDEQLFLEPLDEAADGAPRRYPVRALRWPERRSHGQRQTELPDGGLLQHADAPEWDAWWAAQGQRESWVVGLQQSWRAVAWALLLTIGLLGAAWAWGVPAASQFVAQRLPAGLDERLGETTLRRLDESLLKPTRLPEAQTAAIERRWRDFVERAHGELEPPAWQLHWRHAEDLGPNALALPGGHIIVTDQMVALLRDQPDTLLGVLAHELGHVKHRDGMDAVVRASLLSALVGVVFGDASGFIASVPAALLTQSYSREVERRADAYSAALLHQGGLRPTAMLPLFERLAAQRARQGSGSRSRMPLPMALASHPADEERVRFFREWSPRP